MTSGVDVDGRSLRAWLGNQLLMQCVAWSYASAASTLLL
jgi:hypothetical protein